ncbi:MAG: response regulator, partial [Deltaproteobacteria bacterium]|nr:response regulator [Deltaproteobacteria bacterium]
HDFNNLLMAIEGNISLLLIDKRVDEAQRERIAKIERYILDARKVTEQLLGFAMGGKYEIRPLDINETINKTCEMFGRTKKEIKIQTQYQEGIWAVEADRGQIEQVLLNLYVNAWQAMPGGGNLYLQTENISLSREDATHFGIKQGSYVKISITDTGIGMDKDTQARIFDPFFTTKEIGRGTGLGLASAYGIIKNHGGIINVYSEIGQGTSLHIYLPASKVPVLREDDTKQDISRGAGTILVVDDEEMILDVAEGILKSLGYTVLLANEGREAIEIYHQKGAGIELVVLDIIMPGMSGGETYDRLKEIDPEVRVLLSSGYSMDGKAKDILNRGCNGFIQKPFNVRDLSIKLKEIIQDKNKNIS